MWTGDEFIIDWHNDGEASEQREAEAKAIAKAKLTELYPDNDNPLAYWD